MAIPGMPRFWRIPRRRMFVSNQEGSHFEYVERMRLRRRPMLKATAAGGGIGLMSFLAACAPAAATRTPAPVAPAPAAPAAPAAAPPTGTTAPAPTAAPVATATTADRKSVV